MLSSINVTKCYVLFIINIKIDFQITFKLETINGADLQYIHWVPLLIQFFIPVNMYIECKIKHN